ncbi:MAG: class I SAM-dependent methyltransferase [Candidatus Berkiellales bacterium]
MSHCYNCHSTCTKQVFFQEVITYQNVLVHSVDAAKKVPKGKLDLYFCQNCTFLFNAAFDDTLVGYGPQYENTQQHSAVFEEHITHLVNKLLQEKAITNQRLLEIGCGNGYFLKRLINAQNNNIGIGYDKSLGKETREGNLTLKGKYYDAHDEGNFDVILSRHVIEHILDNNHLIALLQQKNKHAQYFIETPSLEWIIANQAFYDIFYEHCSYFSKKSLACLFNNRGINVAKIETVFNGQYLWLESGAAVDPKPYPLLTFSEVKQFFSQMLALQSDYQELMDSSLKNKKIVIWGAGAKGVTFANLIDPTQERIKYIIDINPKKWGKFIPGTGHQIVNPEILFKTDIDTIIIMNPNYEHEIKQFANNKDYQFISVKK